MPLLNITSCLSPYRYKPLCSLFSIRVVEIVPELVDGRHIGCLIYDRSLLPAGGKTPYQALSYLWGDPAPSRQIGFTDGDRSGAEWHLYSVHENLWRFLHHVWKKKLFGQFFWTDRLCLDQSDPNELAQQIPRMGTIYSKAESVMIWLDLSSEQEQVLQHLRKTMQKRGDEAKLYTLSYLQQLSYRFGASNTSAIQEHEYWNRMWILQEVAMAQTAIIEMQETSSFDLAELQDLWMYQGKDRMTNLALLREAGPMKPQSSSLLLRDHCQRQCSRLHDRVYGLLGMLEEDDPMRKIKINYEKPASEVFFDALFTMSSTFVPHYMGAVEALTRSGLMEDPNDLEKYRDSYHTEPRLRDLAHVTLEVVDALNLILAGYQDSPISYECKEEIRMLTKQFDSHDHHANEMQWKAITGIILVLGTDWMGAESRHIEWKELRWPRMKNKTSWLCTNHAQPLPDPGPEASLSWVQGSITLASIVKPWAMDCIVEGCARHAQDVQECEASKLILEIVDIGFRLELNYREASFRVWLKTLNGDEPMT